MSQPKRSRIDILTSGFFKENPVLVLMLGLCSTLAITTNLNNAIGMGLCVIFVLVASNVVISLIRNITPDDIRIPVYIVVIATLVKVVDLFLHAYVPSLYNALGTFLGLIVVNCIILGRAEAFASKNSVFDSFLDGLGMGIGYSMIIVIIAFFRQLLATGAISMYNPLSLETLFSLQIIPDTFTIATFSSPTGAFITFAAVIAAYVGYTNHKAAKAKKGAK
ncbi:MAG TPA: electron transport complex subunit RsxE [Erysipelothrix sp.]|jgi:electron transport complex protein RnfE|nr:electron transport complex subunit RsxE [Erysipelothrix sp.]